ncbi:MAG: aminopeptidase P N-terminal domain-containing protein [Chloroflexi bacterium]|nr:aminopeptidase P N-terminal domain-containing protein [Chloroflexota bacterium]
MVTMPLTRCSLSERADAPSGASEWDSAMGGGAAFPPVGGDKPGERMCATRRRGSMFTCDFSVEEFRARRERVCREIGPEALALIQGSARQSGHSTFRQSNDFYYLCGVEVPTPTCCSMAVGRPPPCSWPTKARSRESTRGRSCPPRTPLLGGS